MRSRPRLLIWTAVTISVAFIACRSSHAAAVMAPLAMLWIGTPGSTDSPLPVHESASSTPATERALRVMTTKELLVGTDPSEIVYPSASLVAGRLYPALVFAHGRGMDHTQLTQRTDLAAAAAAEGWLSAAGDFGGRAAWADDTALTEVADLVAELVVHQQADPRRIYLVGFSMGGGTALLAAANPLGLPYRVAAVASSQGFTDLAAMTLPEAGGGQYAQDINVAYDWNLTPEVVSAHSPLDQADKLVRLPVYLEHGAADANVPVTHSLDLAAKLSALGRPPVLHVYRGLTHGEATIHTGSIIAFFRGKQVF